ISGPRLGLQPTRRWRTVLSTLRSTAMNSMSSCRPRSAGGLDDYMQERSFDELALHPDLDVAECSSPLIVVGSGAAFAHRRAHGTGLLLHSADPNAND